MFVRLIYMDMYIYCLFSYNEREGEREREKRKERKRLLVKFMFKLFDYRLYDLFIV